MGVLRKRKLHIYIYINKSANWKKKNYRHPYPLSATSAVAASSIHSSSAQCEAGTVVAESAQGDQAFEKCELTFLMTSTHQNFWFSSKLTFTDGKLSRGSFISNLVNDHVNSILWRWYMGWFGVQCELNEKTKKWWELGFTIYRNLF